LREIPGLDEEVIALLPQAEAPRSILEAAISLSA
jgi:hypothetical protein